MVALVVLVLSLVVLSSCCWLVVEVEVIGAVGVVVPGSFIDLSYLSKPAAMEVVVEVLVGGFFYKLITRSWDVSGQFAESPNSCRWRDEDFRSHQDQYTLPLDKKTKTQVVFPSCTIKFMQHLAGACVFRMLNCWTNMFQADKVLRFLSLQSRETEARVDWAGLLSGRGCC